MNTKLLSISLAPMLLVGSGAVLASAKVNKPENWHLSRPSLVSSQVRLGTQQPPLYLASKDDREKECLWLGICDDKDKK